VSSTSSTVFERTARVGLLVLALAGCAASPPGPGPRTVELTAVPFFPQTQYQCGPAALATLLNYAGRATTPAALVDAVYVEGLKGSLQAELLAATRRSGLIPYPLSPEPDALHAELAAGRPVLVLQNLGLARVPAWHYAVVVGFAAERNAYVLRSGTEIRRMERIRQFERRWSGSGRWSFVALRPGELPARPEPEAYVRAVASAERWLETGAADLAYEAALQRWPAQPLVMFAAAAQSARAERWAEAASRYRALLALEPAHAAARNNYAHVLAAQGCHEAALVEAERALSDAGRGSVLETAIADTVTTLRSAAAPASGCAAF
jgi:tetratricopeptide (TPR) repeat protein